MSNRTLVLDNKLYDYLLTVSLQESALLQELRERTAQLPAAQMQIAPEQGQFMRWLIGSLNASRTLEIGVFTGYSTLITALALPGDGVIVACDISEEYTAIAKSYWQRAGVAEKIQLHLRPALETLQQLLNQQSANSFDFAFIDADKENYEAYYEACLQLIRPGGVIAIDNTLWGGQVVNASINDADTVAIRKLNEKLYMDARVSISLLPLADGLTLIRKL